MPPVPPLIDFLAGVLTDPGELASFRRAPATFLAEHGYEGIDDDDATEALSLVADTMPPAVAAGLTHISEVSPGERMDALYDVREGFDEAVGPGVEQAVFQPSEPVSGSAEAEADDFALSATPDTHAWAVEEPALSDLDYDFQREDGFDAHDDGLPGDGPGGLGDELASGGVLGGFEDVNHDLGTEGAEEGGSEAADIGLF